MRREVWENLCNKIVSVLSHEPDSREKTLVTLSLEKLRYNLWHRTELPRFCYATDIDFVEWAAHPEINIKALLETKRLSSPPMPEWQKEIYKLIGEKLQVPVWSCRFSNDLTSFWLKSIHPTETRTRDMNEQDYRNFQVKLHQVEG